MKLTTSGLLTLLLLTCLALSGCGQPENDASASAADEGSRGPHGGWLLREGDVALELAIFEEGVPPEFRAWVDVAGEQVSPETIVLEVTLTRLGGVVNTIGFRRAGNYLAGDTEVTEPHSFEVSVSLRVDGRDFAWQFESFEGRTRIADEMAKRFGLETEAAGPGVIREEVEVFGRVAANPEGEREIGARFPGVVRAVRVSVGDQIRKGGVLARVESDESLNVYDIVSPIDGVIVARNVDEGEHTGRGVLFTVRDTSEVWVELAVFPRDLQRIEPGMPVTVFSAAGEPLGSGPVDWIDLQTGQNQSVRVRTRLPFSGGSLLPGSLVSGRISVARHPVALAVQRSGLQTFREWSVVFARVGDEYEVRMLELGREDDERVEVLKGLRPGERYVTRNSYLVKADIEKAGALHEH